MGNILSTNSIVPVRPIYSCIFHDMVFIQWLVPPTPPLPCSELPWPVRCLPSTLQWNIDVKSLESWVSHLSWWYHKAPINSVREHQTYHRHIIGYEGITECTCLEISSALPGGRPLVGSKKFVEPIPFPAVFASPIALFISHWGHLKMASCLLLYDGIVSMQILCMRDLCIITSSVTICCWLVDLPWVSFLMVFSCIWVMYWCINNVIII